MDQPHQTAGDLLPFAGSDGSEHTAPSSPFSTAVGRSPYTHPKPASKRPCPVAKRSCHAPLMDACSARLAAGGGHRWRRFDHTRRHRRCARPGSPLLPLCAGRVGALQRLYRADVATGDGDVTLPRLAVLDRPGDRNAPLRDGRTATACVTNAIHNKAAASLCQARSNPGDGTTGNDPRHTTTPNRHNRTTGTPPPTRSCADMPANSGPGGKWTLGTPFCSTSGRCSRAQSKAGQTRRDAMGGLRQDAAPRV